MDENTREIFVQLLLRNIRQMYYSRAYCYPRLERFMVHAPPPPPPSEEQPPSKETVDDPPKAGAVRIRFLLFFFCHACIGHFGKYHNILCLSPQILHKIVLFWDLQWSQEKTKTMLLQNLGGQTKSIMVFSEMSYCECYQEWM